jgi:GxxExxY protein
MLNDEGLSQKIIGAAINVHKQLGPGFLESIYEQALAIEFNALEIPFDRQFPVQIYYRNQIVGEHRLDFLVNKSIVVELKAIQDLEKIHFSIVRSYLKATGLQSGLLFNFAMMPLTIKRVGREASAREPSFMSS